MNQNLYSMDLEADRRAEQESWKEAYDISDLPDDDG
jgi:hypothetical protein